jgi:hypothetical protein
MNVITNLQTEMLQGGRLENGRINHRVLVAGASGGAWYELSMSNDRANQREITVRREDCQTPQPVTATNAGAWLTRLRDHKEAQLEARNIIPFVPQVQPLEVGA